MSCGYMISRSLSDNEDYEDEVSIVAEEDRREVESEEEKKSKKNADERSKKKHGKKRKHDSKEKGQNRIEDFKKRKTLSHKVVKFKGEKEQRSEDGREEERHEQTHRRYEDNQRKKTSSQSSSYGTGYYGRDNYAGYSGNYSSGSYANSYNRHGSGGGGGGGGGGGCNVSDRSSRFGGSDRTFNTSATDPLYNLQKLIADAYRDLEKCNMKILDCLIKQQTSIDVLWRRVF